MVGCVSAVIAVLIINVSATNLITNLIIIIIVIGSGVTWPQVLLTTCSLQCR